MNRPIAIGLYVAAMVIVIVGVDFAFLRDRFWERLMLNIGIVLLSGVVYWVFFRRS